MADVAETSGPPAVDQSGNLTIWWVPTIANVNSPTATEIGATAAKRVTYSFTPDGWALTGDQEMKTDDRLTLTQSLESLGKSTASLVLKYVDSSTAGSAAVVLTEGLSGFFVERRNTPNSTLVAAAQKVRVIPVTLGKQIPGPVDGNGKFTYTQKVSITGIVGAEVAVV
ncbi:MAG TPA: hypothetical protein VFU07_07115 [Candidatus Lumbricidophila sp.]|nr:hypothetical protein [Candidatus Lumbricidophila sp.]